MLFSTLIRSQNLPCDRSALMNSIQLQLSLHDDFGHYTLHVAKDFSVALPVSQSFIAKESKYGHDVYQKYILLWTIGSQQLAGRNATTFPCI